MIQMAKYKLYSTLTKAIKKHENSRGEKPSLVQINRQDYVELSSRTGDRAGLGLSIGGVAVVSFEDIDPGKFNLIA